MITLKKYNKIFVKKINNLLSLSNSTNIGWIPANYMLSDFFGLTDGAKR